MYTFPLKFEEVDFYIFQLSIILYRQTLNNSHLRILAYYHLYEEPIDKLLEDNCFSSRKSIENYVSELRKLGILVGKGRKSVTKLNPSIRLLDESCLITLNIDKLDATK